MGRKRVVAVRRLSTLHSEDGAVAALVALAMPVVLLFAALVIDVGNWKEKDRNLQARADAAALAAGVEYVQNFNACFGTDATAKATAAAAITARAKQYAGDSSATAAQNQGINEQSRVWVGVNALTYGGADASDGSVCDPHPADNISPANAFWTDVKMTEANIPSFFGSLGFPLDEVNARARVEMKQIIGVSKRGLPFIAETGDEVECVYAQFVNAATGVPNSGFTVTPSNPVNLTKTGSNGSYTWRATNVSLTLTDSSHSDIAVRYWFGSTDGGAACDFNYDPQGPADPIRGPVPRVLNDATVPVSIDWLNVYDDSANPGAGAGPKLRKFVLTGDSSSCGGPGYLYTADLDPFKICRVNFAAEIDTGSNNVGGSITVVPSNAEVTPVTVNFPVGTGRRTVTGVVNINPNEEATTGPPRSGNFNQVGEIYFRVNWVQTSGTVQGRNCAVQLCSGTFRGTQPAGTSFTNAQHGTFVDDPLTSVPLVSAELALENSIRGENAVTTGPFTINLTHTAIDQDHVVLIRDSVQSSGNRTRAIYCGNSPGQGNAALTNAVINGCFKQLVTNTRSDSCDPEASADGQSFHTWDCVQLEQGNKTALVQGFETRFQCTTNAWAAARGATPPGFPPDGDQRWAYIVLTGYGRTFSATNGQWLPIEGLLKIYVTGWDKQGGGGGPANCAQNDPPPRGYDSNGAQIWGHIVEPITLDPSVITGGRACEVTLANRQCKIALVR